MRILLCGAADVVKVQSHFTALMDKMNFDSNTYIDGTLGGTNANDWGENSREAVENAHLIVFVLIQDVGDITWNTEYITAVNLGKPYILLCEEELADHYFKKLPEKGIKVHKNHKFFNAKPILDLLVAQKRTIIRFDLNKGDFNKVLSRQINCELERAASQLQLYYRNRTVLERIRSENYKSYFAESITADKLEFFKKLLFDPFEHKELRKRILYFFTIYKGLTDEKIIELFEDSEQGISRMAVDQAPRLLTDNNNKEFIVKSLIQIIKDSQETGTIRRAISTIFEIDIQIGLKYIFELLPAYDIGTPKRILSWLLENINSLSHYLKNPVFDAELHRLINHCKDYSSKPESNEKLAERLLEKISSLK